MRYYPVINKNLINIKDFYDETIIYLNELNLKKIILNKNAKFIFDNCNGKNSIHDVTSLYFKANDIKKENQIVVQNDIANILCKLDSYGIVSWKDRLNPFTICKQINNLQIYPVKLNNRYFIKEHFQKSLYSVGIDKTTLYNNQLIVNGIYTKLIHSYFIKKDNENCALVMINMVEHPFVWQVMAILYNENFDLVDDSNEIFNNISTDLDENVYNRKKSFGFYIDVKKADVKVCELLGFQNKGYLKYESDINIYSMWHVNKEELS